MPSADNADNFSSFHHATFKLLVNSMATAKFFIWPVVFTQLFFAAFLISAFFTQANLAACCGAIFYFTLYLPYAVVYQYEETMAEWMKYVSCLLSPVAFGYGTTYIARFEEQGIGIQWSNINQRLVITFKRVQFQASCLVV